MSRHVPSIVIVPVPFEVKMLSGTHTSYEKEAWLTIRASQHDREIIQKAAEECRTARSMFLRWVGVSAARQILNHVEGRPADVNAILRSFNR